jgi:DNA adenine methylase
LVHGDFERTIDDVRRGDFVYLDPPFATSARRIFVEYDKHPFRVEDLSRVRCWLRTIDSRGAKFLLSYAYCPEVLALSREWNHSQIRVTRNIAGFAGHRRKAVEILVHNL